MVGKSKKRDEGNVTVKGRPATGKPKTSTERGAALEAALKASGGRILSRVRLSPDAAKALVVLSERLGSDRAAIEHALIKCQGSS